MKMLEEPTPVELCRQQKLLSLWVSSIVNFDGSLNLLLDDLRNVKTMKELETGHMIDDENKFAILARAGSTSLAFTGLGRMGTMQSCTGIRNGTQDFAGLGRNSTKESL